MFIRQTEGVYQFGSKKIFIKVERGDQVQIRVGGGFMPIGDFLDTYTQQELETIRKKNPLTRFHSKLAIQKFASENAEHAAERSPVRSPQRAKNLSPNRKSLEFTSTRELGNTS